MDIPSFETPDGGRTFQKPAGIELEGLAAGSVFNDEWLLLLRIVINCAEAIARSAHLIGADHRETRALSGPLLLHAH
jgi:hypothetical protein